MTILCVLITCDVTLIGFVRESYCGGSHTYSIVRSCDSTAWKTTCLAERVHLLPDEFSRYFGCGLDVG